MPDHPDLYTDEAPSMTAGERSRDRRMLLLAARAAARAHGRVEPNPMVGCVIACGDDVVGVGHHRVFGGPHAEREALEDMRRRFPDLAASLRAARASGSTRSRDASERVTMYVTLEPCSHFGKTPPCTDAVIESGVPEVVFARHDTGEHARGGAALLRTAGVRARLSGACPEAAALSEPFFSVQARRTPWVIAKWAQTIDGRIATRDGESQWISCAASRRRVHRLRGRVDAVLTGIGTVLADDPLLTSRVEGAGLCARPRRVATRVVIDAELRTPVDARLVRSLSASDRVGPAVPLVIVHAPGASAERVSALRARGAELIEAPTEPGLALRVDDASGERPARARVRLDWVLGELTSRLGVSSVLVEAGPGLVGAMLGGGLVDEMLVFVAPMVMGDEGAPGAAQGLVAARLGDVPRWRFAPAGRCGRDVVLRARRGGE